MNIGPFDALVCDGALPPPVTPARGDYRRGTSVGVGASWRDGTSAAAPGTARHRRGTSVGVGADLRRGTSEKP